MLIGGSVVIETIFGIPGMGRYGFEAILTRDYNVVMAILLISSILTLVECRLAIFMRSLIRESPLTREPYVQQQLQQHSPSTAREEDLTYGDIVWGQFRKNRIAFMALIGLIGLALIAIFCPLIASDRPFIWTENGNTTYPWFTSLFDRNYYENGIDIFFNLTMVLFFPIITISWGFNKFLCGKKLEKRRHRKFMTRFGLGVGISLLLAFFVVNSQSYEEPYKQYYEEYTAAQSDESDADISATLHSDPIWLS